MNPEKPPCPASCQRGWIKTPRGMKLCVACKGSKPKKPAPKLRLVPKGGS